MKPFSGDQPMGKQAQQGRGAEKEQFWREEFAGQATSGLSVRAWCQRRGISEPSFYHWRAELKRRMPVAKGTSGPTAKRTKSAPSRAATRFVPIRLTTSTSQVEFALTSGLVIRVPAQDLAALRAVLEIVEPRSC
jgi:transposase